MQGCSRILVPDAARTVRVSRNMWVFLVGRYLPIHFPNRVVRDAGSSYIHGNSSSPILATGDTEANHPSDSGRRWCSTKASRPVEPSAPAVLRPPCCCSSRGGSPLEVGLTRGFPNNPKTQERPVGPSCAHFPTAIVRRSSTARRSRMSRSSASRSSPGEAPCRPAGTSRSRTSALHPHCSRR